LRYDHAWAAEPRDRPRRLTTEDRDAIQSLAATRSLRDLAADFVVSHETVQAVLRSTAAVYGEAGVLETKVDGSNA